MSALFHWFYCLDVWQAFLIIAAFTILFLWLKRRFNSHPFWKPCIALLLVLWVAVVIFQTVLSRTAGTETAGFQPLLQSYSQVLQGGSRELLRSNAMNVFLFYPAGLLAASLLPKNRRPLTGAILILLACLLLSFGIELFQYRFCLGEAEADDILHNTLGGVLGAAVVLFHYKTTSSPTHRRP